MTTQAVHPDYKNPSQMILEIAERRERFQKYKLAIHHFDCWISESQDTQDFEVHDLKCFIVDLIEVQIDKRFYSKLAT